MMIGPAPMIRIDSRSVRLGMRGLAGGRGAGGRRVLHQRDEAVEQVRDVVRARARLRVALEAERRRVEHPQALVAAVEQRAVRDLRVLRQCGLVDREAVVLAGDQDAAGLEDRKSTRLNSSHVEISYAVFCLKKKMKQIKVT